MTRQGITIDRSTLASWVGYAAAELKPLWRLMRDDLLGSTRLFVDETPVPVLDPGRGRTKTGYFWTIARDDRPWGGKDPPAVVYTYAPGRGADHALALLKDFSGILQSDGYRAYKTVAEARRGDNGITLVHCWAHRRRGSSSTSPRKRRRRSPARRSSGLPLYDIEAEIEAEAPRTVWLCAKSAEAAHRGTQALVRAAFAELSRKSTLAEAIRYALNHWSALIRLDDGRIEIDSNTVERSIRPIALNRKNARLPVTIWVPKTGPFSPR